jgi:hypothetical protein
MSKFWKKLRENDCYMEDGDADGDGGDKAGTPKASGKKRKASDNGTKPPKKARGKKATVLKAKQELEVASEFG